MTYIIFTTKTKDIFFFFFFFFLQDGGSSSIVTKEEGRRRAGIKFGGFSVPPAKRLLLQPRSRGGREGGREREERGGRARAHVLTSPASSRQRSRSEVRSVPSPPLP